VIGWDCWFRYVETEAQPPYILSTVHTYFMDA
jgi:hypothetical protein